MADDPSVSGRAQPLRGRHVVVANWRDLEHSLAGGSERYAWEYAVALADAGARVEFLTARDAGQSAHARADGIEIHRRGGPFTYYFWVALALLRRRRTLDVVIDPECGIPSWSPLWVGRRTRVVMVVHHVHQQQFATYFPRPLALVGQILERVVMKRVYRGRRVLAVSASTRHEMEEQLDWTGPVEVLENGSELPAPGDCGPADKDVDRLVVLGRLVPHKRVDVVLRAVAEVVSERPRLHVDVCGKGPEAPRLHALATGLGIADRVTFHGFVSEERKHELLKRAGLQVCGSDVEGWGQVVIEAASYGVPTIARDVPGLRESVHDQTTGWLVPDDPDLAVVQQRLVGQLRTTLAELDDPASRDLVFKACQHWASGFGWARMRERAVEVVRGELAG